MMGMMDRSTVRHVTKTRKGRQEEGRREKSMVKGRLAGWGAENTTLSASLDTFLNTAEELQQGVVNSMHTLKQSRSLPIGC